MSCPARDPVLIKYMYYKFKVNKKHVFYILPMYGRRYSLNAELAVSSFFYSGGLRLTGCKLAAM